MASFDLSVVRKGWNRLQWLTPTAKENMPPYLGLLFLGIPELSWENTPAMADRRKAVALTANEHETNRHQACIPRDGLFGILFLLIDLHRRAMTLYVTLFSCVKRFNASVTEDHAGERHYNRAGEN